MKLPTSSAISSGDSSSSGNDSPAMNTALSLSGVTMSSFNPVRSFFAVRSIRSWGVDDFQPLTTSRIAARVASGSKSPTIATSPTAAESCSPYSFLTSSRFAFSSSARLSSIDRAWRTSPGG
jgi:hypothetical protein